MVPVFNGCGLCHMCYQHRIYYSKLLHITKRKSHVGVKACAPNVHFFKAWPNGCRTQVVLHIRHTLFLVQTIPNKILYIFLRLDIFLRWSYLQQIRTLHVGIDHGKESHTQWPSDCRGRRGWIWTHLYLGFQEIWRPNSLNLLFWFWMPRLFVCTLVDWLSLKSVSLQTTGHNLKWLAIWSLLNKECCWLLTKILAGLRSRWSMPFAWRDQIPGVISSAANTTRSCKPSKLYSASACRSRSTRELAWKLRFGDLCCSWFLAIFDDRIEKRNLISL